MRILKKKIKKKILKNEKVFSARKKKKGFKFAIKRNVIKKLGGRFKWWEKKKIKKKKRETWWEKKKKYKLPKKYKPLILLKMFNRQEKNKRLSVKSIFKYTLYVKQAFKLFYGNLKEKTLKNFCIKLINKNNKLTKIINFLESRLDSTLVRLNFAPNFKIAREWIRLGGVVVNKDIKKNSSYKVKKFDSISLNTKIINQSFFYIQKKYSNICWRYKALFRKRKNGFLRNFWKYKKFKNSKTKWARSFFFFLNFTKSFIINYNTLTAIKIKEENNVKGLKFNIFLKNFRNSNKLFKIILAHYLNKK